MTFFEFFGHYWWLMFPVFGMLMGVWGMNASERRTRSTMDLIKSYVDQGKEPPPELLKLAADSFESEPGSRPASQQNSGAWSVVVFTAMAAGFGVGYYMIRTEEWAWAFLLVTVVMAVMAAGALLILLFGRR